MVIYKAIIADKKTGKIVGEKLTSSTKKKVIVGSNRKVVGFIKTRLKGSLSQRRQIPRSRRFGSQRRSKPRNGFGFGVFRMF